MVLERERASGSGGNVYILGNEEAVGLHSRGLEKIRGGGGDKNAKKNKIKIQIKSKKIRINPSTTSWHAISRAH